MEARSKNDSVTHFNCVSKKCGDDPAQEKEIGSITAFGAVVRNRSAIAVSA
jgi:hypothetical protein